MRKPSLSLMLIVLLAHTVQGAPAVWYVSKSGNNSNSGLSTNAAFLTIQKAASLMNQGDTCYIFSGTYRETVTPPHSGISGLPITFTAYPGATVIVSGADVLNVSWSVYSNSIYQASTTNSFRQLFVDGVMMNEARWPNATVNNLLYAPRSTPTSVTLTNLTDTSLPSGLSLVGAYMHFFASEQGNQGYAANTRQITSWNSATKTFAWSGNVWEADSTGCFYYLYGALSLLDIPTEWYLDTTGKILYLWTTNSASPSTHVVEIKNRTSAFTLDNRSYVTISNIYVFAAGISMANTTSCIVNNCNLMYVQHNTTADYSTTIPIANQVSGTGSMWENSTITYSSQDGIRCSGQNEIVSNCVIQQVDYYPGTYYACVTAYNGTGGTIIISNTLLYSGRYCVGASTPGVQIAYNNMGWGELLTSDGGAEYVYSAGDGGGTTIHHNWAHNSWAGVYIDGMQNNYLAYNNVCYSNYIGLLLNNNTTNDLFINNTSLSNSSKDILCNGTDQSSNQLINNLWHTTQTNSMTNDTVIDDGWYPPVGANFVLSTGSAGIHGGEYYTNSPILEGGYNSGNPDIGAYQNGVVWTPGANFTAQPFPNSYALPFITGQPVSQTNYTGQTAMLTVVAASVPPIHYQWQMGTANSGGPFTNLIAGGQFSGVTNATLTISNLALTNTADFEVVLTNSNGSSTSTVATLTVLNGLPYFTMQPVSQEIVAGQFVTFTVTTGGLMPQYFQWEAGAVGSGVYTNLIAGGQFSAVTNTSLTISNLTVSNTEDYVLVVSNAYGSVTSAPATLTVVSVPPYQTLILGDNPYAYWPLQETAGPTIHDIVGTNNGTLMVSTDPGGEAQGRDYHETFANASAMSDGVSYALGGPGFLYGVPSDAAIYFTNLQTSQTNAQIVVPYNATLDSTVFSAEAWLNLPIYPIGYTNWSAQIPLGFEANAGNQSGWYIFVDTDTSGNAGEVQFNLAHGNHTGFTTTAITNKYGGQWVYAAEVYDGTNLYCYQNGSLKATIDNPTYCNVTTLSNHIEPLVFGSYCQTYNAGTEAVGNDRAWFFDGGISHVALYHTALTGSQVLNHYLMGVNGPSASPPIIGTQPVGVTNYVGYSPALSVTAGGTAPLVYQWFRNSAPLAGQTNDSLTLSNLVLTNAGSYFVSITNAGGSNSSTIAVVSVLPLPSDPYQSNVIGLLPRAFYPLHETGIATNGVTVAADVIREGSNNGTYASQSTPPLLGQPGASSYLGTSVTLNATAVNGIYVNDPNAMGIVGPITLEAWVLVQDIVDQQNIIAHGPSVNGNPSQTSDILGIDALGEYYIDRYQETANPQSNGVAYAIPNGDQGQWVYLVGTADGAAWHLYRNAQEVANSADTIGANAANGGWAIGARDEINPFGVIAPSLTGSINNVAIYDYALTPGKILAHYQIGLTGATSPVSNTMTIQPSGTNVIVTWQYGTLQQAGSVLGPWTDVFAVSPYTITATNTTLYFRAIVKP